MNVLLFVSCNGICNVNIAKCDTNHGSILYSKDKAIGGETKNDTSFVLLTSKAVDPPSFDGPWGLGSATDHGFSSTKMFMFLF